MMDSAHTKPRLRSNEAAEYLRTRHGLPISDKTLRNRRCTGTGPVCQYFGAVPLYSPQALDEWVAADAVRDQPPKRAQQAA
jgi:hypothetical protein